MNEHFKTQKYYGPLGLKADYVRSSENKEDDMLVVTIEGCKVSLVGKEINAFKVFMNKMLSEVR